MQKLWVCAVILLLGFTSVSSLSAQSQNNRKKTDLQRAKEHVEFEEYLQAIPFLEKLLAADPDNPQLNFWMGKSLYMTYRKNQALKYFESVEKNDPAIDKEFHHFYALTLHYNMRLDDAIREYRLDMERYKPEDPLYREASNRIQQCTYAKRMRQRKEGDLVKINNLGDGINTEYSEHSPVVSANDSILVFTARRPECMGADPDTYFYDEDVYIAFKQGGAWTTGTNISTPVNSRGHDATISFTADGKKLYFYRHKKAGGLYEAKFDPAGKKWKEPSAVVKPLNSKYYEASICESAKGDLLFFTSDRPGGFGGRDIYMVKKSGADAWSEPVNLGPRINTAFDEDAPYFHPDGKTLYYSSNGPASIGGFDIFVTEWDSMANGWLEPLNMGPPINTPDDEIYFVLNKTGLTGYYASGKEGGFGEKDIYEIKFPYFRYPKRYYAVDVLGIVQDANTLDTLTGTVRLIDEESGLVLDSMYTDPTNPYYRFEIESGQKYRIEVQVTQYDRVREELAAPIVKDDDITLEKNFFVKRDEPVIPPPPAKVWPDFQHIYFDFDKYTLRKVSTEELDRAVAFLNENPDMRVEILGHTDWFGTYDYNVKLSENRSNAVVGYLRKKGVAADRIKTGWMSETKPIETNDNDDGRQYNRRSELRFYAASGEMVISSQRLRTGGQAPEVDHTQPRGKPGYDGPGGPLAAADAQPQPAGTLRETHASGGADREDAPELSPVYFGFDQTAISAADASHLRDLATWLSAHPEARLEISGHACATGSSSYNQSLSARRCAQVRDFLVQQGITADRLLLNARGNAEPAASDATEAGRQLNRRAELHLVY